MHLLPALRRRLARIAALLTPPAPPHPALRTNPDRPDRNRPETPAERRAADTPRTSGAPPAWLPASLHGGEEGWIPVLIELHYEREDPLAVEFTFHGPTGTLARWSFSRDLLLAGLNDLVGQGEVMIWPSTENPTDSTLFLRLGLQERHALLAVHRAPVHNWLTSTLTAVPIGHEMAGIDWDEEERQLLRTV
ncbi:SsgA family sporulation/cell division regulator [Streptomyces sp. V2I9]|uniref:SsgA family sporulation/cell division regulator n=1 Tax=Streptomyces sp. V2I9 TaxID=3042304 RepID=UPI00277D19E3|nr:SsgA family sporulation/cell division regulator [Streptomyces sp. V2I9]MDQ0988701.1 hypothetical protein [Streptomyces sp. V2I9]